MSSANTQHSEACPDAEALASFLDSPDCKIDIANHVCSCSACQKRLDSLLHDDELVRLKRISDGNPVFQLSQQVLQQVAIIGEQLDSQIEFNTDGVGLTEKSELEADRTTISSATRELGKIGDYRLLELIGRGGVAVVYKAWDEKLERLVALKVLQHTSDEHRSLVRFQREATIVASIKHSSVVDVYHAGYCEERKSPYLAMEYVDAPSLRSWIRPGETIPIALVAEWVSRIADGLHEAHEQGIVHRDIKPSNILMSRASDDAARWEPKLADFGLALIDESARITQTGYLSGTPAYMSPEQVNERSCTPQSDIYSLGITLYELLTGELPYRGSPRAVLHQVVNQEVVSPRTLRPSIPIDLETICLKAVSKEPKHRYSTAREFAEDLRRFLDNRPTLARPVSAPERALRWAKRNRSLSIMLATSLGLLGLLLIGSISSSFMLFNKNQRIVEEQRRYQKSLIERIPHSDPASVPLLVEQIRMRIEDPTKPIEELWRAQTQPQAKLNLACALLALGKPMHKIVLDNFQQTKTDPGQFSALLNAFQANPIESLSAIRDHFATASSRDRVKLATLALYLGDGNFASDLVSPSKSPDERTLWIHQLPQWRGSGTSILEVPSKLSDPDLSSAVILGLGQLESNALSPEEWEQCNRAIQSICTSTTHSGVRGACFWLANTKNWQWGPDLHKTESDGFKPVKEMGFSMVRLAPGVFRMGNDDPTLQYNNRTSHEVRLTREFWIADREVSVADYHRFQQDTTTADRSPSERFATVSADEVISPTADHPMQSLSWYEAAMFCNWLSNRDGLSPVYRVPESAVDQAADATFQSLNWERVSDATGYRLPSEAEFEYAARASTRTKYHFGNDRHFLEYYACWSNNEKTASKLCGELMPNPWGLFDLHGNVWEWSDDWFRTFPEDSETDPHFVEPVGQGMAHRGGGVCTFSGDPVSSARGFANPRDRSFNKGFRVVRGD